MNIFYKVIIVLLLLVVNTVSAQIGVGTRTPHPEAMLEVKSTNKGLLLPRVVLNSTTSFLPLSSHVEGMSVYNTATTGDVTPGYYINNGSKWIRLIADNSSGALVSIMTSTEREAIASPVNGSIIFNTTNNTLEVYKNSCTCWISISDSGNTPANNAFNTAPVASNLNVSGSFVQGQQLTLNYSYIDSQNDPEGLTSIQWQRATTNTGSNLVSISSATSATYTLGIADANKWVRAVITPRASSGVLNGIATYTNFFLVDSNTAPTATNVLASGTAQQGSLLSGTYAFFGGTGTESTNPAFLSIYQWERATTSTGLNANIVSSSQNITPESNLIGLFVRFGVRARDNAGILASNFVYSQWVGPITAAPEQAPQATNLSYSPNPSLGTSLTASYDYFDANGDPEGSSIIKWYRANDVNRAGEVAIPDATSITYTPINADVNKFIGVGITPLALTGSTTGLETKYYNENPTLGLAGFTFTSSSIQQQAFFNQGRTMNATNNIIVEVNVSTVGAAAFTTTTVNGYSFSLVTTFTSTGVQWITLTASGILGNYSEAGDNFTITGIGSSNVTKSIIIKNTLTGAFATLSNGTDLFSANSNCTSSLISAGYDATSCSGNVTVGSNTYSLVHINGQCWMQSNLKESPTTPCGDAINTGCNVWLNTNPPSGITWGFYNSAVTNGSAGWGATELLAADGLLYQWAAAMKGSTLERSQGVCPSGWHIPSDCEWMYLEHGLGMSIANQTQANSWRVSGTVGSKLGTTTSGGNNSSGFTARLRGFRNFAGGVFSGLNSEIGLWSSTQSGNNAFRRQLGSSQTGVYRDGSVRTFGFSVRCIKD